MVFGLDILIETSPGAIADLYACAGIKARIAALCSIHVDVVNRDFLKSPVCPLVEATVIQAF